MTREEGQAMTNQPEALRVYTTLNKIRAHGPCPDGWAQLLRHLGKKEADDEPLALATILDSNGLGDALWCLRAVDGYQREMRLFAVWCARQVQHMMADPRSLAALDVAERHAAGKATDDELAAAGGAARDAAEATAITAAWAAADAAWAAADAAWVAAWAAADAAWAAADAAWVAARDAAWAAADAAWVAARDAAWAAAGDAAWAAAGGAAWAAAGGAAGDAARDAAITAAGDAAEAARGDQKREFRRIFCGGEP